MVSPRPSVEIRNSSVFCIHSSPLHRVASAPIVTHAARASNARDSTRYAEIRSWKGMTHDVGRGGPYIRGRRAVNCPLHVRESNRADMKPWNASRLQFFPVYDPLAIYRGREETWISNRLPARSFFNCDVRFGSNEFSETRRKDSASNLRSCGGEREGYVLGNLEDLQVRRIYL